MSLAKLQAIGISIWWSEGTKSRRDKRWKKARSYPIEVTNTNPQIITIFLMFLREVIKVPESRLALQLQIHVGDNQKKLENYWSEITGIDKKKFNKTIIRPIGKKVGKSLGTCKVRFADKNTYLQLEQILISELKSIGVQEHGILISSNRDVDLLK